MIFRKKNKAESSLELIKLSPNIITLLAICIGLFAIRMSFEGRYLESAGLVILAAFMDAIDGRLARFLNSTSKFGAQLDSLADFVNFGVTPGFVIYNWVNSFSNIKGFDWALVLLFAICAAIRLARFNVAAESDEGKNEILEKYFFQGIAAPCGASLAMVPIMMTYEFGLGIYSEVYFIISFVAIIALLMSSKVPTISIKKIPVRNDFVYATLVFLGVILIGVILKPWYTLTVIAILYISSIPVTIYYYLKITKNSDKN